MEQFTILKYCVCILFLIVVAMYQYASNDYVPPWEGRGIHVNTMIVTTTTTTLRINLSE